MSVLKNLKSIFIVADDDKAKKEDPKKTINKKTDKSKEQTAEPKLENVTVGEPNKKIIETLFKAIEKQNLEGFDYIEFKKSVKDLEEIVSDEATRFKSAFSTASTIGVTKTKLVDTAQHYVKVLNKEKDDFIKAADGQSKKMVDNRKEELDNLLQTLETKKKEIEQLKKDLIKGEARIKTIQKGIDNSKIKIENTKKNFDASWHFLKDQIVEDIHKIKSFLK